MNTQADRTNPWQLTPRQEEVLRALLVFDTDKAIAKALNVSVRTVEGHVWAILHKMDATSRVQAAVWWDRWAREAA